MLKKVVHVLSIAYMHIQNSKKCLEKIYRSISHPPVQAEEGGGPSTSEQLQEKTPSTCSRSFPAHSKDVNDVYFNETGTMLGQWVWTIYSSIHQSIQSSNLSEKDYGYMVKDCL
jgi:hypothetical protein